MAPGFGGEWFNQIRTWVDWGDGDFNGHGATVAFKPIRVRIAGPNGPIREDANSGSIGLVRNDVRINPKSS